MKNKNIFFKLLLVFIFATIVVAENALPYIGSDTAYSISFFLFLMYLKFGNIQDSTESFIYGFLKDSISSIFPFGFFSLLYLIYFYLIKYTKGKNINEIVILLIFVFNYLFCCLVLNSFDIYSLVKTLIFYIAARIVTLLIFKL